MKDISIHGRNGQGNVEAAYLLEQAALLSGKFAQAFAAFEPECPEEHKVARVQIFDPKRDEPETPDQGFRIVQDHRLLHSLGATDDLPSTSRVLVNWSEAVKPTTINGRQIVAIPASCIAMEFTGQPLPNVALVAALVTMTEMMPLKALEDAMAICFRAEALEHNLKLVRYVGQMLPAGVWKDPSAVFWEFESREAFIH